MGLFGAIVGTLVETAKLPISALKEVDDVISGGDGGQISENLDRIKDEADDEDDD